MSQYMGLREYARHRGVSLATVQRKIKRKLIPTVLVEDKVKIEPERADKFWEFNKIYSGQITRY